MKIRFRAIFIAALFGLFAATAFIVFAAVKYTTGEYAPSTYMIPCAVVAVLVMGLLSPWDLDSALGETDELNKENRELTMRLYDEQDRVEMFRVRVNNAEHEKAKWCEKAGRILARKRKLVAELETCQLNYDGTKHKLERLQTLLRAQFDANELLAEIEQRAGIDLAAKVRNAIYTDEAHRAEIEQMEEALEVERARADRAEARLAEWEAPCSVETEEA